MYGVRGGHRTPSHAYPSVFIWYSIFTFLWNKNLCFRRLNALKKVSSIYCQLKQKSIDIRVLPEGGLTKTQFTNILNSWEIQHIWSKFVSPMESPGTARYFQWQLLNCSQHNWKPLGPLAHTLSQQLKWWRCNTEMMWWCNTFMKLISNKLPSVFQEKLKAMTLCRV